MAPSPVVSQRRTEGLPNLAIAPTLVAMTTMNISLPDSLKSYVDAQVAARGYGSASEYLRDLIRRERDRQHLRELLLEGAASGPGVLADAAFFDSLRDEIRDAGAA